MRHAALISLFAIGLIFSGFPLLTPPIAQAQTIQLSNDERGLARILRNSGYTDMVITKRAFSITTTEACRGSEKFKVKVSILGQITSVTKIGNCTPAFNSRQAHQIMQRDGYRDIDARPSGPNVVATGCHTNRKYELTFNRRGDLINRNRMGRCGRSGLTPDQIRADLRKKGYDRVQFTDDQLPKYVIEACLDKSRMQLNINRNGQIRRERRIGKCPGAIDPANLSAVLRQQGFSRVEIVQDRRAPYLMRVCRDSTRLELIISRYGDLLNETKIGDCRRRQTAQELAETLTKRGYNRVRVLRGKRAPYLLEACQGRDMMELTVSRSGRIRREERVGRCASPVNREQLATKLSNAGYSNVTLTDRDGRGWRAEACKGDTKLAINYDTFGKLVSEQGIGSCKSKKVSELLRQLEDRGANNVTLIVEGCYKRRKYRWHFDRLGNRTDRERISGGC